jgi:hypothetical protein
VFIIDEDAESLLTVQIPSVLHVPIFELHSNTRRLEQPILDQVQERLEALLDAAKFETCTNDTEPDGAFYGLVRSHLRLQASPEGDWVEVVNLGLVFSESGLTPQFGADPMGFYYHEMTAFECQADGLPIFVDPTQSEPEVHRPTRFEREDVI